MSPQNRKDRGAWLEGAAVRCEGAGECAEARWRLVLLGAPGVGKGAQADLLTQRLRLFIFSTSDIFRAAVRRAESEPTSAIRDALGGTCVLVL
jgi:adenylate kinase